MFVEELWCFDERRICFGGKRRRLGDLERNLFKFIGEKIKVNLIVGIM